MWWSRMCFLYFYCVLENFLTIKDYHSLLVFWMHAHKQYWIYKKIQEWESKTKNILTLSFRYLWMRFGFRNKQTFWKVYKILHILRILKIYKIFKKFFQIQSIHSIKFNQIQINSIKLSPANAYAWNMRLFYINCSVDLVENS